MLSEIAAYFSSVNTALVAREPRVALRNSDDLYYTRERERSIANGGGKSAFLDASLHV